MDINQALYESGVRDDTLTSQEKESLDKDGYLHLRGILTPERLDAIRTRQQELLDVEGENAGTEVHQERGTDRLSDLINKGEMFHIVLTQPKVLASIAHVLQNDLKLSSLNSRNALPGQGLQRIGRLSERHGVVSRLDLVSEFQDPERQVRVFRQRLR